MASSLRRGEGDVVAGATTFYAVLTDATDHVTTAITATGGTDYADVRSSDLLSLEVLNGATNSVIFTVEKSDDGTHWLTTAYGQGSSAAYTQAALTVTGGSYAILHLPPDDYFRFLRVNVSAANANGTTFTVHGRST
jgi:hypothetical protein